MIPFFRFLTGMYEGYSISWSSSFGQEVAAGGTTNKAWTGLIQVSLTMFIFTPLGLLFPSSVLLTIGYWASIPIIIGLTVLASICHFNQMQEKLGNLSKITKLPFDLHKSPLFTRLILLLSENLSRVLYVTYFIALLCCVYSGFYLYPIAVASTVLIDQLYQQRWFPKSMETPYFILSSTLLIFTIFGFSNWFLMGLSVVNVGFFAWDYVQTHLRGVQSASSQFSMASPKQQLSFDDLLNEKTKRPTNKVELDLILDQFITEDKDPEVRITFNHFRDATLVIDRLIGNAPQIDFNQFNVLFNQLDFQDPELRHMIENEMVLNDKFDLKTNAAHQQALNLDVNTQGVDLQIAYLKQEMEHAVAKLIAPVYKDLNHQQINTMIGQARLVLDFALKCPDETKKRNILLSVAIQAGSHCFRQFSETFAELFHAHVYQNAPLSIKDKAVLVAQSVREVKFKDYYYYTYEPLQIYNVLTYKIDALLTLDKHDYHAYENFAVQYGQFFYLQNQTLSQQTRSMLDILSDYFNTYFFLPFLGKGCLFSEHYNAECLIQSALSGSGKAYKNSEKNFYTIFEAWCNAIYPGAYQEIILDEDYYPLPATDPRLRALVKLMLLDLGLVELMPEQKKQTDLISEYYGQYRSMTAHLDLKEETIKYKKKANNTPIKKQINPVVNNRVDTLFNTDRSNKISDDGFDSYLNSPRI